MLDYRAAGEDGSPGKRVLLVSTRRAKREPLARELETAGWHVEIATSGVGGLLVLREAEPPFDWLICELAMPGLIDGRRLGYEYLFQRPLRAALFIGMREGEAAPPEGIAAPHGDEPQAVVAALASLRREHIRLLQAI
jgi:hypothetical protein